MMDVVKGSIRIAFNALDLIIGEDSRGEMLAPPYAVCTCSTSVIVDCQQLPWILLLILGAPRAEDERAASYAPHSL